MHFSDLIGRLEEHPLARYLLASPQEPARVTQHTPQKSEDGLYDLASMVVAFLMGWVVKPLSRCL